MLPGYMGMAGYIKFELLVCRFEKGLLMHILCIRRPFVVDGGDAFGGFLDSEQQKQVYSKKTGS